MSARSRFVQSPALLILSFLVFSSVGFAEVRTNQTPNIDRAPDGGIHLAWATDSNALYSIEYASTLNSNSLWRIAETNFRATNADSFWTDVGDPAANPPRPSPNGVAQRFYRITQLTDKFGIRMLYPSSAKGLTWLSGWDDGHARTFGYAKDSRDPWFDAAHGDASHSVDGSGTLTVSGRYPRMYVHDPALIRSWKGGLEFTVYGMRIADSNIDYGGIVIVLRSNHGTTGDEDTDNCDTRGIAGRVRYDGDLDFEKEICHSCESYTQAAVKNHWPNRMPTNMWIGAKFVVYDLTNGNVRLELWMDESGGVNGGNWVLQNSFVDSGSTWGSEKVPCRTNIDPALALTDSDNRPGSESGKPNITVYMRTDAVKTNGFAYKKASVREIVGGALLR